MKPANRRYGLVLAFAALCLGSTSFAAEAAEHLWRAESDSGLYRVEIRPDGGRVEIGALQDWRLKVEAASGTPVERAQIVVGGGMPGHGHGLPTQPLVTSYLGGGQYRVEGVKLSMSGAWVLAFAISSTAGNDIARVSFDVSFWTNDERELLQSLYLAPNAVPPPSPSNRVADDVAAAEFGRLLFFDERLSEGSSLSCASCHQPDRYFTDNLPRGIGVHESGRNTPTVIGAAFQTWLYWDGRRESLWSQALVPFEAASEMGSSRTAVIRFVGTDPAYRAAYQRVFGKFPDRVLADDLPEHAGPLGPPAMRDAWYRIKRSDAELINTVYANIGKAVAAFQRTLPIPSGSRFDRYVEALSGSRPKREGRLSRGEVAGLKLFLDEEKTHCLRCHSGPWFTNGEFHNIGTGTFEGPDLDFGRVFGLQAVLADEFNCRGRYSDANDAECSALRFLNRSAHVPLEGAFKVPGLRNLSLTAPYMHDGRFASLSEVIEFYRSASPEGQSHELPPLDISDKEARQLELFLLTLTSPGLELSDYVKKPAR